MCRQTDSQKNPSAPLSVFASFRAASTTPCLILSSGCHVTEHGVRDGHRLRKLVQHSTDQDGQVFALPLPSVHGCGPLWERAWPWASGSLPLAQSLKGPTAGSNMRTALPSGSWCHNPLRVGDLGAHQSLPGFPFWETKHLPTQLTDREGARHRSLLDGTANR